MIICVLGTVETEQFPSIILCHPKKNSYSLCLMQGQENLKLDTQNQ
jgi:hypothetical protein